MKRMILVSFVLALVCLVSFAQPTWTSLTSLSPTTMQFRSIEFLSGGVVWVQAAKATYDGLNYVFVSTDNGGMWAQRTVGTNNGVTSPWLSNVSAVNANTAIVGTTTGEILRTTNGGVKWDTVLLQYNSSLGFMDGVKFINADTAIAFGDADSLGSFLARSTNGGATWTRITSLPDSSKRSEWFAGYVTYGQAIEVYNRTIWCAQYFGSGKRPFILKSTDAGTTWTDFPIALPGGEVQDYYLKSINFKDASVGYGVIRQVTASTNANYLVKTTDGGATWSDTISVAPGISHDSAKVVAAEPIRGTSVVIASGYAGSWPKAWKSTDDGATWTTLNCPPTISGADLKVAAFVTATTGFIAGNKAAFQLTIATGVGRPGNDVPAGYALDQNFPNPFNPSTVIPYSIAKSGHVELLVRDMLGRTVATLVNGVQSAGSHEATFNASNLASGVYFYSLRSGEFYKTRSLVLLK